MAEAHGDRPGPAPIAAVESLTVEPQYFAPVPEWVIDAEISDGAFRVYAVLMRYGDSSGQRMPSRAALARRLRRSSDSVDRALRELEAAGLVEVERRTDGRRNLTNLYHLRTSEPGTQVGPVGGHRSHGHVDNRVLMRGGGNDAATSSAEPQVSDGESSARSRTDAPEFGRNAAAGVAAGVRHNPEVLTQSKTTSSQPYSARWPKSKSGWVGTGEAVIDIVDELLVQCGIDDLDVLVADASASRRFLGKPTGRWARHCVLAAAQLAVLRGWPPSQVPVALAAVAADPATVSPMRLAEAGPWWDQTEPTCDPGMPVEELDRRLESLGDRRVAVRRRAQEELASAGLPLTRTTVFRRACEMLDRDAAQVS